MPDLPPLVVDITGDASDLIATLTEVESLLSAFADKEWNATLGINQEALDAALADAEAKLAALADQDFDVPIGLNLAPLDAEAAELSGILGTLSRDGVTIPIRGDITPFLAALEEAKAAAAGMTATIPVDANIAPAIAAMAGLKVVSAAGGAAAGAAASEGFLTSLGFGLGGGIAGLFRPVTTLFSAGFGSIAALMGFGIEHLLTTGLGLLGSAAGAGLGGGLLGLGALGVGGVGTATDLAGIGQAAGDTKQLTTLTNNLAQAVAVYGQNSIQAALATYQLNQFEQDLSATTITALTATMNEANAFHAMFDSVTADAETKGAELLTQIMQVGEKFLPTIGKYASENMTLITQGLQPLFTWLQGPGLGLFKQLEQEFTNELPTAMQAFDQGLELFLKIMTDASTYTGGFLKSMDAFFTKWNSPSNWAEVQKDIANLIGLFRTWDGFVKVLVEDIALLFSKTAGLGSGIIQELTGYLQQLHSALESTGKDSGLENLFTAHRAEVQDLIAAVIELGKAFGTAYIAAAPLFTQLATVFIKALADILELIEKIPGGIGTMILGWGLLLTKMGILGPLMLGAAGDAGILARAVSTIGDALGIQTLVKLIGAELLGVLRTAYDAIASLITRILGIGAASDTAAAAQVAANEEVIASNAEVVTSYEAVKTAQMGTAETGVAKTVLGGEGLAPEVAAGIGAPEIIAAVAGAAAVAGLFYLASTHLPDNNALTKTQQQQLGIPGASSQGGDTYSFARFGNPYAVGLPGGSTQASQQQQQVNLLQQIQTHVAAIHSIGAKDVTVAGVKAAVAASQIAAHPATLGSGGVLNVADAATKQIASLGSKEQTLGRLEANIIAMGQVFGKGSPQEIAAVNALKLQAETWFPQLAKDTNVKSELSTIAEKQAQLFTTITNAATQISGLKSAIAIVSGGKSLSDLQAEEKNLEALLKDPAKGTDVKALHTDLQGVQAKIADVKLDTSQLKNLQGILTQAENQENQLTALKDGLTGALTKVQTAVALAGTNMHTDLNVVSNKLGDVTIAKLPPIQSHVLGNFKATLTVT